MREQSPGPMTSDPITSFHLPEIYARKLAYPNMSINPINEGPNKAKQRFDSGYKVFHGKELQRNRGGIDTPGVFYETMKKDKILSGVAPLTVSKIP
jgi:hypothetical protein